MSKKDGSRWNLEVTPAGGTTTVFRDLAFVDADCHRVDWIGFISNAEVATSFFVDNLHVGAASP
jgi:hypothetical protein